MSEQIIECFECGGYFMDGTNFGCTCEDEDNMREELIKAMLDRAFSLGKLYQAHTNCNEHNNAKTIKEDFEELKELIE